MNPTSKPHRSLKALTNSSFVIRHSSLMTSLVLALASANITSAQSHNTTNGPHAVTTNGNFAGAGMTTGDDNTAYGFSALKLTDTGSGNTAVGSLTLQNNKSGINNTAVGFGALTFSVANGNTALGSQTLQRNTSGANNTATGVSALVNTTTGSFNTATGREALSGNIDGANNTAVGYQALLKNTSGDFNVALGDGALQRTTGSGNIGIGEDGGFNLTVGDNNICIGNKGFAGDSNIIRIGTAQTATFLTGIIHGDGSGLTGVPASSVTGTFTTTQIANAAVTSVKLGTNLTLGGTTNGTFNGNLTGNATNVTGIVAIANGGTGSAVKNFVDLSTNQTSIGGTKAFTGNVGIGTASPLTRLHIKGTEEGIRIDGPTTGSANVAYMSFRDSAGTRIGYVGDGSTGDSNVFLSSDAGDITLETLAGRVLTAKADGNVGIGTTTPGAKLHANGTVFIGNNNGASPFTLSLGGSASDYGSIAYGVAYSDVTNSFTYVLSDTASMLRFDGGGFKFKTAPTGIAGNPIPFTDAVTILQNGAVGIGTNTPTSGLEMVTDTEPIVVGGLISAGPRNGRHLEINQSSIEAFQNGTSRGALALNNFGGDVFIGSGFDTVEIRGTFVNSCDRNIKDDFAPVEPQAVLDHLQTLPLSTWKYKAAERRRHIGPTAQDFHAAFDQLLNLKSDDTTIAPIDEAGVAFAAIQALQAQVAARDEKIAAIEKQLAALQARDQVREARLTRLENGIDNKRPARARAVNASFHLK